jgi:hypothetical protein
VDGNSESALAFHLYGKGSLSTVPRPGRGGPAAAALIHLQLGDSAPDLTMTGRGLSCELVGNLNYRRKTERKRLRIG